MPSIQRILCPIDFSESSLLAFEYAQSAAWHYGATILLQHVVDSLRPYFPYHVFPDAYDEICQKLRADAVKKLQDFTKKHNRRGVQTRLSVQDGNIANLILEVAEERAVNLIVMGTHGLRGIDHLALGSVTEKVLRKAGCPVLTVRNPTCDLGTPAGAPDVVDVHRIVCCMDFSEPSAQILDQAVSVAAEYGAELTLLHVLEAISRSSDIEHETAEVLKRLEQSISPWAHKHVVSKPVVRIGKAYQQIIQLALESQTDLVVMGARGIGALDSAVFGSTTHRVVLSGPCPVLVIHTAKDRERDEGQVQSQGSLCSAAK